MPEKKQGQFQPAVLACKPVLDHDECQQVLGLAAYTRTSGIVNPGQQEEALISKKIRDGRSLFIDQKHPQLGWLYDRLWDYAQQINSHYYAFDIDRMILQFTQYEVGHFYDWHMDMLFEQGKSRKFGFSVQLSDPNSYEGGDVEFNMGPNQTIATREQGRMVVFPAYILHRVKPITRGQRCSLVGWISGAYFR